MVVLVHCTGYNGGGGEEEDEATGGFFGTGGEALAVFVLASLGFLRNMAKGLDVLLLLLLEAQVLVVSALFVMIVRVAESVGVPFGMAAKIL